MPRRPRGRPRIHPALPVDPAKKVLEINNRELEAIRRKRLKDGPDLSQPFGEGKSRFIKLLSRELSMRALLSTVMYVAQPEQLAFHKSQAVNRLAIGSNRGMKTTCCAVETAWAVLGRHPYRDYPKEDGRAICVAKDGRQLGQVMYRKLFKAGAFRICKDEKTGLFRAWKGHVPGEVPFKETKLAPPLIPKRYIKDMAWENKAESVPSLVTLKNGWEILFCSSLGKPPQGVDIDLAWFDEEVKDGDWYPEIAARRVDRGGAFYWSATPQLATDRLWTLHEEAEEAANKGEENRIQEFHYVIANNPFITEENKQQLISEYSNDPDEYKVRILGQFKIASQRVYPDFRKDVHCTKSFDVPVDWCKYLAIDPGFANFCCLFVAVPPPASPHYGHVFVIDEQYSHQMPVRQQAERLFDKYAMHKSQHGYEAFLIDAHGSRRSEMMGLTIADQYEQEFRRKGISSLSTEFGFYPIGGDGGAFGTRTLAKQVSQVRSWLIQREELNDKPILQIFEDRCPKFIAEMEKYKNKLVEGQPTDEPDARKYSHGPDALRYAVLYGVPYVKPRKPKPAKKNLTGWDAIIASRKLNRSGKKNHVLLGAG